MTPSDEGWRRDFQGEQPNSCPDSCIVPHLQGPPRLNNDIFTTHRGPLHLSSTTAGVLRLGRYVENDNSHNTESGQARCKIDDAFLYIGALDDGGLEIEGRM